MKALLLWPKFASFSFWNFEKVCELVGVKYMTPPLGLVTLAALLPADWDIRIIDENVRPVADDDLAWADLVLVSSKIVHRQRALDLVRRGKALGRPVAAGGPDVTMRPQDYVKAGADYIVLGEGEVTVPLWLDDLAAGATAGTYQSDRVPDMRESPTPRFDLINLNDYLYVGLQYSRGCPYKCEFCNVIDLFKNRYRTKDISQVLKEFDLLYDLGWRGQVDFFDDNLVGKFGAAKELLKAIAGWQKAHGFPFILSSSVTLNVANDDEVLALLRECRFKYFLVGIETPDQDALERASKQQNKGFSIPEATDRIYRKAGATLHSGFLLGMDGESPEIGDMMIRCIDEAVIPWVMAGVVYPLPGTRLAKRLDAEGRLFPKARGMHDDTARDQISAGIQFRTERPAKEVLADLLRVMRHAFEPKEYFKRCAEVANRLNTVPMLFPGLRVFLRNIRTVLRLTWVMSLNSRTRWPYWKAWLSVLWNNRKGLEALGTLSVLFAHFNSMMPYVEEQLEGQMAAIDAVGEEAWYAANLREPDALPPGPEGRPAGTDERDPALVDAECLVRRPA